MRRVLWSEDALGEFVSVVAYIARDNPGAARRVADRIDRTVSDLAVMPSGRRGRVAGTYEEVIPRLPYIVAYALRRSPSGDEEVVVLCVIHGARDWPKNAWPQSRQPNSE
ncbi:MAG: type II toxin-antitoxin system RelE/ParE family toxin [Alphaproteobacteria bacterium]|nr:type II toxin-antitoxin system RelE/ParE family toxin [Alphaproteobacteria bacterium]